MWLSMPLVLLVSSITVILMLFSTPITVVGGGIPEKGTTLPAFELPAPSIEADANYLGLKGATFQLKDVDSQVLVVEIIGVYCPHCYKQAPLFNSLQKRLQKKGMDSRVKMLAIAAGGTSNEIEHLRKNNSYNFPVVKDESYAVHKLLGEPRTPFTMVVGKDGKVLATHMGIIEDMDSFYQQLQELAK